MVVLVQNITCWEIGPLFIRWNPDNASFFKVFLGKESCSQMAVVFLYIVQIIYDFVFKSRKAQVDNIMVNCFSHVCIFHSLNKERLIWSITFPQRSMTYLQAAALYKVPWPIFKLQLFYLPCNKNKVCFRFWTCLKLVCCRLHLNAKVETDIVG